MRQEQPVGGSGKETADSWQPGTRERVAGSRQKRAGGGQRFDRLSVPSNVEGYVPSNVEGRAAGGTAAAPAACALCGARMAHVYMWTADGRRVHIDCYAPALVRETRTERAA